MKEVLFLLLIVATPPEAPPPLLKPIVYQEHPSMTECETALTRQETALVDHPFAGRAAFYGSCYPVEPEKPEKANQSDWRGIFVELHHFIWGE